MPHNNYNAMMYNSSGSKLNLDEIIINDNIYLNHTSNIWCGKYNYTYSKERLDTFKETNDLNIFLSKLDPSCIAEKYYMKHFIYDDQKLEENKIEFSKGTIYLGSGQSSIFNGGKIDIQTSIRALCRQEIEYALWNYTSKLIENNLNENLINNLKTTNIDSFRLKWFVNKSFPIKDITLNGFPIGTDDTEFKEIKNDISLKKKIFLN